MDTARLTTRRLAAAWGAALLLSTLGASWRLGGERPPAVESPPLERAAAAEWLAERAAADADPTAPGWRSLMARRGLAIWYRGALDAPRPGAPAIALAAADPALLEWMVGATGRDPEQIALLLDPDALDQLLARCPVGAALATPLCDPGARRAAEQAIDQALLTALGATGPGLDLMALEAACGLGERGAAIAARALALDPQSAAGLVEDPGQLAARAVTLQSWTLPRDQAIAAMRSHLERPDRLALLAALELGRLGDDGADDRVAALADRYAGTGDAVLAEYARALAAGAIYSEGAPAGL